MKKIILSVSILCMFATGFRGGCLIDILITSNPALWSLITGMRYTSSEAVQIYYLAAGDNGTVYRSSDPRIDPFVEINTGISGNIKALRNSPRTDTSVTFGVGDNGLIVRSLNQGFNWITLTSGTATDLNDVEFLSSGFTSLAAIGDNGMILTSSDCGNNWVQVASPVSKNLNSIYSINSFITIAVGDDGTIIRTTNGGMNWVSASLEDTTTDLNKIGSMGTWFFGTIMGIAGDNGALYQSTNYLSWTPLVSETTEDLYDLRFRNASSGFVTGNNGAVRFTTNGGFNWYSDPFINSVSEERINSSLILNDTTAISVTGNMILLSHANESLLPVEMSLFTYSLTDNDVELKWTTSSETNNAGFHIECSVISREEPLSNTWSEIGFVTGNGNSTQPVSYSFIDNDLRSGRYAYRLKQTDYNGNFEYFSLNTEILIGLPENFTLDQNFPNPFNPSTKISFGIPYSSETKLSVFDISGKEIATLANGKMEAGNYVFTWNASGFSTGVYFYKLTADGFTQVKKMMLLK